MLPPFEKGYYGQLERLKWVLGGNMGMVGELGFGRTNSLVHVVLLFNFMSYIPLLMNIESL
jgi:hypothetical protein